MHYLLLCNEFEDLYYGKKPNCFGLKVGVAYKHQSHKEVQAATIKKMVFTFHILVYYQAFKGGFQSMLNLQSIQPYVAMYIHRPVMYSVHT